MMVSKEMSRQTSEKATLASEIILFANSLPYWARMLSGKLLSHEIISDDEIDILYSYLLEDVGLKEKNTRPEFSIDHIDEQPSSYKTDLRLSKLHNVEGVNALVENQIIEFSPNVTVIYGANGSGKSGYVRLLKKAFFNRTDESIIPNIHIVKGHKSPKAEFVFVSSEFEYPLIFPEKSNNAEFHQFSVFDSKCIPVHLNNKNEFEYRPSGLNYFAKLTEAFKRIEGKLNQDIDKNNNLMDYASFFDGESEIKVLISKLAANTKIDEFGKYLPFSDTDKEKRKILEEQKARLQTMKKDKDIGELAELKQLIKSLAEHIINNNKYFSAEYLRKVRLAVDDYKVKDVTSKRDGINNFATDKIANIGSTEWKAFIEAAEKYARQQVGKKGIYPRVGDYCLLCHQPLSEEAQVLIAKYWTFIKSQAEQDAKDALKLIEIEKNTFENLKYDVLLTDSIMTKWLSENYPKELKKLKSRLSEQNEIAKRIIINLTNKNFEKHEEDQTDTTPLYEIISVIDKKIDELKAKEPKEELERLSKDITLLNHREKLQQHISGIKMYVDRLSWAAKANSLKRQLSTRKITDKEKELSGRYFNQAYINTFNKECDNLNGKFGIDIIHTGSSGTSYRQLFIKGKQPSQILSEGEQNVISLADFLSEIKLSGINRGIIFDDPVTSLDEERKSIIAERIVKESSNRQVIIFTHDLVFVSAIISECERQNIHVDCHWIETDDGKPGRIWLRNNPSYEKKYRKSQKAQQYYDEAKKCGPEERENHIKNGFAALRTSYESLVVFDLFKGVVQRFNERVSIDSLASVSFNNYLRDTICDGFANCCRYMEGHSHSDKYSYKKPTLDDFKEEIERFNKIKKELKENS